jgi:hypothetical protein
MPCPSIAEPSQQTQGQSVDYDYLANPNPTYEHVSVDEEGLYIDLGPQHPPPPKPHTQGGSSNREAESSSLDTDDESVSDDAEYEVDDMVKHRELEHMPNVDYDKRDPPMAVGTIYLDINSFKLALATHATKNEFHYIIEKSYTRRYRAYCKGWTLGC